MTARRAVRLTALAAVVAAVCAGSTLALLGTQAEVSLPVVRTGDLGIVLVGTPAWTETSPDVTAHTVTAPDHVTAAHLATAGDTFEVRQRFRTVLTGDNLEARLSVRWGTPPSLAPAGDVVATYVVTRPDGVSTAATPVGTEVTVPGSGAVLTSSQVAAWGTIPWTVTVTLRYTGDSAVVVPPSGVADAPVTSLGSVVVELDQVRGSTP